MTDESKRVFTAACAGTYQFQLVSPGSFSVWSVPMRADTSLELHYRRAGPHPDDAGPKDPADMDAVEVLAEINEIACLDDQIYDVRNRVLENDPDYKGSTWNHPTVERYGELVARAKALIDET